MPNLGPGVPQSVNPAVTPTWIFTPVTNQSNIVQIINTGRWPVYVGPSGVDQPGGLAVPPGSQHLRLQNVSQTLYAVSQVVPGALSATQSSGVTAGSTAITLNATVPTALAAGTTIIVGSTANSGWEAQVVATTTASSQLTFANPLVNDHYTDLVYVATAQIGQITVIAGVL